MGGGVPYKNFFEKRVIQCRLKLNLCVCVCRLPKYGGHSVCQIEYFLPEL